MESHLGGSFDSFFRFCTQPSRWITCRDQTGLLFISRALLSPPLKSKKERHSTVLSGLRAAELASPAGVFSVETALDEVAEFFRGHPEETHVVIMAGTRVMGLLGRGQVEDALERARAGGGPQRILVAALHLADPVCIRADCKGANLEAEIIRCGRRHSAEGTVIIVVDGRDCVGIIRPDGRKPATVKKGEAPKGKRSSKDLLQQDAVSDDKTTALVGMLGACSVPSAVFDRSGHILYANAPFETLAGDRVTPGATRWGDIFEEAMDGFDQTPSRRCDAPCSASHALTLTQSKSRPSVRVEAEVDALHGGHHTLVSVVRCVKAGEDTLRGCFCRFKVGRRLADGSTSIATGDSRAGAGPDDTLPSVSGEIRHFALVEVVQFLAHGQRTGVLEIIPECLGGVAGQIVFKDGNLRHAVHGDVFGESALQGLLSIDSGIFRFLEGAHDGPETIQGKACAVLFAACVRLDEETNGAIAGNVMAP